MASLASIPIGKLAHCGVERGRKLGTSAAGEGQAAFLKPGWVLLPSSCVSVGLRALGWPGGVLLVGADDGEDAPKAAFGAFGTIQHLRCVPAHGGQCLQGPGEAPLGVEQETSIFTTFSPAFIGKRRFEVVFSHFQPYFQM